MTRQILAWAVACVLLTAFSAEALASTEMYREGSYTLFGVCYDFRVVIYDVQIGGGETITKAKVFMSPCGANCFALVYDGPKDSYTVPIDEIGSAFPITVGSGGHGYVTVPSGQGGLFAPEGASATCEASFTPDYSATLVIDTSYIDATELE